jgi:hypothetical protein
VAQTKGADQLIGRLLFCSLIRRAQWAPGETTIISQQ